MPLPGGRKKEATTIEYGSLDDIKKQLYSQDSPLNPDGTKQRTQSNLPPKEKLIEMIEDELAINIKVARPILEKRLLKFNKHILEIEKGKDRLPLGAVHKELCTFIDENKKKKKLVLIPRGHLKSSVVTVGRSLQAICANPNVRILLANATYGLACSFLTEIKRHLKNNEKIKMFWGDLAKDPEKWSENQISLNRGTSIEGKKEATVTAMGLESNLTSQHYDIIIADDLVNKDYVNTPEQIQKSIDFYKECLNLLDPGGEMILIGTRWHDSDLYGWLLDPENNAVDDFETFIRESHTGSLDTDEGFSALYPEKFDRKHLFKLYQQQGPYVFSCQYLNNPIPVDDADFRPEWFHYYDPEDLRGKNLNKFLLIDPAISLEKRADYSALVSIGVDEFSNVYILRIDRAKLPPDLLIELIFQLSLEFNYQAISLEDVAYQKVLHYSLENEMRERQVYLPIKQFKPNNRTKDQRIRGLQPLYANGKVFHRRDLANMNHLEDELLRFPRSKHDDTADALSQMLDIAFPAKKKKTSTTRRNRRYLY